MSISLLTMSTTSVQMRNLSNTAINLKKICNSVYLKLMTHFFEIQNPSAFRSLNKIERKGDRKKQQLPGAFYQQSHPVPRQPARKQLKDLPSETSNLSGKREQTN